MQGSPATTEQAHLKFVSVVSELDIFGAILLDLHLFRKPVS